MRVRIALVLGLVGALAVGAMGLSQAGSGPKVTGGGQTDVGTSGAGDTIAFTAQENRGHGGVTGQVQFIDREDGTQTVYHGTVNCLVVSGDTADFSGTWRGEDGGSFEIVVQDTGEGNGNADPIAIEPVATNPDCGDDDVPDDEDGGLARGNAQVHE